MPRGVAIPELRQQLFAAAERVIAASGVSGLTGRAVTRESYSLEAELAGEYGNPFCFFVSKRSRRPDRS